MSAESVKTISMVVKPEMHPFWLFAVATPKQIRELMQVEGLTNDEVKSHLQVSFNLQLCLPLSSLLEFDMNAD